MFNNIALDVFIGLIFVYLLYSLLATIVQEIIAVKFSFRSKILERAILRMLEDGKTNTRSRCNDWIKGMLNMFLKPNLLKGKALSPWFYAHPLIKYLGENNYYSKPAYITQQTFSKVMIDLLRGFEQSGNEIQRIDNSIKNKTIFQIPIKIDPKTKNPAERAILIQLETNLESGNTVAINEDTAIFLQTLWEDADASTEKFRIKLEQWFNDTMERSSGWYKRYTQSILLVIGIIIAIIFNVDTIAIHRILSKDKTARDQMVQMAVKNQDKLGKMVNDTSMVGNDSLLKSTYNIVLNDANAANQILGLGRVWKDSCKVCDSMFVNCKAKTEFSARSAAIMKKKIQIESLRKRSVQHTISTDSLIKIIKNVSDKTGQTDTIALARLNAQLQKARNDKNLTDSILSKLNTPAFVKALKKEVVLAERCPYILEKSKTWFVYAPNQNGGFETLIGWLLTGLALSLGAPFWFDLLNKLIKLRGTGNRVSTSQTETTTVAGGVNAGNAAPVNININNTDDAVG